MGRISFYRRLLIKRFALRFLVVLGAAALIGCSNQKLRSYVTQYTFQMNDETFHIRSISPVDQTKARNQILGKNLVAADYNQDGVVDRIVFGEKSLLQAQQIYVYGLAKVAEENKLRIKAPTVNRYLYTDNSFQIEIVSFSTEKGNWFNEITVIENLSVFSPRIIILVDSDADGILDGTLKGEATTADMQGHYEAAVAMGLEKGNLIRKNGKVIVTEK